MMTPIALILAGLATQEKPLEPFHSISVSGGLNVVLQKGAKPSITLKGEADDVAHLEAFVKNGRLVVQTKKENSPFGFHCTGDVTAVITAPQIDAIEASGGVTLTGNIVNGSSCVIDASGGVDIALESVACTTLSLDTSGGAKLSLKGTANTLKIDASGGVELKLSGLSAKQATIDASGGVSGTMAVSDTLSVEASGGVSVRVKGHPKMEHADSSVIFEE
jgi:Putative auto-transporter adhesin, head GIN domain